MRVCITGGAGYVGSVLVPELIKAGHRVTVLDTFWFGDHLPANTRLRKIIGDIRNPKDLAVAFKGQDAVIHLACVSNDPSFDMNPELGTSVNYSCFNSILHALRACGVERFIYASSSSVYGVSDEKNVTEDSPKKPLTDYSKFKLACEVALKSFGCGGAWTIVRPATVCGYSPRQRLDLAVNILTAQATVNKKITVFGGKQLRPNIHIRDMAYAYCHILSQDARKVNEKTYNVGYENMSLNEIAELVSGLVGGTKIIVEPSTDNRSYHINSGFIGKDLGFVPIYGVDDAIDEVMAAIERKKLTKPMTNSEYYNIKRMKELGL